MSPIVINVRNAHDARDVVHRAVQAIAEGKVVAFPTETVYSFAVSALDSAAVDRLVRIQGPREGRPFTMAIKSADDALDYVPDICPLGRRLARRCWPGPVTLILEDGHPDSVVRQLPPMVQQIVNPCGSIGLRVPAHPVILDVLRLMPGPLVLCGARTATGELAVTAEEVLQALQGDVAMVLDDGRSQFGQPSSVVQVTGTGMKTLRAGVVSEAALGRLASFIALMVCTGNTCRSPMAEVLARSEISSVLGCRPDELDDRGVMVFSAGISAMAGGRPSPEAVAVMAEKGLDLQGHIAQPISDRLVRHADLIFTMTGAHRQAIVNHWPETASRTFLLRTDQGDVSDPIGGSREVYRRCADQMQQAIRDRVATWNLPVKAQE